MAVTAASGWWGRHESGVLVFAGGAVGTSLRAGLAQAMPAASGGLPVATLTVNVVGAFVLGWLVVALTRRVADPAVARRVRLAVGTGGCGGFTTFSTFMLESVDLAGSAPVVTAGYLGLSLAGGLAAALAGAALGRRGAASGRVP